MYCNNSLLPKSRTSCLNQVISLRMEICYLKIVLQESGSINIKVLIDGKRHNAEVSCLFYSGSKWHRTWSRLVKITQCTHECNHELFQVFTYTIDPPAAILVVGGGQSNVELVDLTDGGAESCISPVIAPTYLPNAAGIWVDDKPTVCGGGSNYDYTISDKCVSYDMTEGKWIPYTSLPETRLNIHNQRIEYESEFWAQLISNYFSCRMAARSVLTSTYGWWITGGQLYPYDYYPQSSTVKMSNGQFVTGESVRKCS